MSDSKIEFTKPGAVEIKKEAPPMRSCASCMFMQKQRIAPTDLRLQSFCFRLPPTAIGVQTAQGLQVNAMHTPVSPHDWCFEYRPNVAPGAVAPDASNG